ncbi:hypothetical protein CROQUDRAFT_24307, partial [Cronartium quercuum f. sp. fusiforme G11]
YPTFKGGKKEDWVKFISDIETLHQAYKLPDEEIISKLASIFKGSAYLWYKITFEEQGDISWDAWKVLIKKRYGNASWRQHQLELLETTKFLYSNSDVLEFLLTMYDRIDSVHTDLSFED